MRCEAGRRNFNLTEVAAALFTSQSGVSKHIKDLEDELGIELFVRRGKKLLGLTDPGKELVAIVERMLLDAKNIKQLAEQFSNRDQGRLSIATTHTQARYVLPKVVEEFKTQFPKVHLVLHQGGPQEILAMLNSGEADIGIASEGLDESAQFATFPYYEWQHVVVVPEHHPLASAVRLSLADIAQYPIITYHEGLTGRAKIDKAFADAELVPDIVLSALDADVIKTYTELGLGVGILARMAFDENRDHGLRLINCKHLFEPNVTRIALRKGDYLRGFTARFIELCAPKLTDTVVRAAMSPHRED
ncbi:MAG: CysB family HTH-type transcriptional regulator [Burkholderiales bacterium]